MDVFTACQLGVHFPVVLRTVDNSSCLGQWRCSRPASLQFQVMLLSKAVYALVEGGR